MPSLLFWLLVIAFVLAVLPTSAHAFGAGNLPRYVAACDHDVLGLCISDLLIAMDISKIEHSGALWFIVDIIVIA